MKPISLFFFGLIVVAAMIFAFIYTFYTDLVETNPALFTLALLGSTVVGMFGMMYNIINQPVTERVTK